MKMLTTVISMILATGAAIATYEYYDRKERSTKSIDAISEAIANELVADFSRGPKKAPMPEDADKIVASMMSSIHADKLKPIDYGIAHEKVSLLVHAICEKNRIAESSTSAQKIAF